MKNNLQQQPVLLSLFPVDPIHKAYPISYETHALSNLGKSKTEHPIMESTTSDSESCTIIGSNYQGGLIKIDERGKIYQFISQKFISRLGTLGLTTKIEAIHKNDCSSFTKQAKVHSFLVFAKAMEKKCGGNSNVKYAWFGASKDEIDTIFSYGFGHSMQNGVYGHSICLSSDDHPLDCLQSAIPDKDGVRHLVLCRVILGRTEVVHPGSGQCHASSEEFDTGVDNLHSPRKYIVWSANMNSYVFPEFMISFRVASDVKEIKRFSAPLQVPKSPWISFPHLISALSKFLPPNTIKLIKKHHSDYKDRKITRRELIQQTRKLVGDKLLTAVIKSCKKKQNKVSTEDSSITSSVNCHQWGSRICALPKQELESNLFLKNLRQCRKNRNIIDLD